MTEPAESEWSAWSTPMTFETGNKTSATISNVSPNLGQHVSTLNPTLIWANSDPNVFYYEVQLSADPTFNTDPATATAAVFWELRHGGVTSPPNSYTLPGQYHLESGKQYYWRVRPRVQGDGTPVAWGQTWSFMTP